MCSTLSAPLFFAGRFFTETKKKAEIFQLGFSALLRFLQNIVYFSGDSVTACTIFSAGFFKRQKKYLARKLEHRTVIKMLVHFAPRKKYFYLFYHKTFKKSIILFEKIVMSIKYFLFFACRDRRRAFLLCAPLYKAVTL